jgi:hypothetical protein
MSSPSPIVREDLAQVLSSHRGNVSLRAAFEDAPGPEALLSVFARYVQFNSAFGAGVANLAGEIAARQGLFEDKAEPLRIVADRAAEVAADFFYAAIDEFDDRLTPWRDTHRTLAQAALKGMGRHFGYSPADLNGVIRINRATEEARAQVWEGYGVGARLEEPRLFHAMGFHAGSEVIADQEFTVIDRVLRERRADLVKALEAMKVEILGHQHDAYYWIRIHTSVEADHFDAALSGVNRALGYYSGTASPDAVREWVLGGFGAFAGLQERFMLRLAETA